MTWRRELNDVAYNICDEGHDPVQHSTPQCPACELKETRVLLEHAVRKLDILRAELSAARERISNQRREIRDLKIKFRGYQ